MMESVTTNLRLLPGAARMSQDGRYRYTLTRSIQHSWQRKDRGACWIMLNPSTADAEHDDPTIRRCIDFTRSFGLTRMTVVNLFAFRATDPAELRRVTDPIGPDNDYWMLHEARVADLVICAWGHPQSFGERSQRVLAMLHRNGIELHCFGRTKNGYPRHPLYLRKDAQIAALLDEEPRR